MDKREQEISDLCYSMQDAYKETRDMYQAMDKVKEKHPESNNDDMYIIWHAIDAYVDINEH